MTLQSPTLTPLVQRILEQRGITSAQELEFSLKDLLPISSLKNIQYASELLCDAIQQQKSIVIVGDFDADGATATTLSYKALTLMGAKRVNYVVPNRFEFGYGLTPEIVQVTRKFQPNLIITVDNGISSTPGVAEANALGIEVLVTDHHLPASKLPDAKVIVNPNQPNDTFESKALAGVGVIFYVMLAVKRQLLNNNYFTQQQIAPPDLLSLLDLVALGTVADVVPLDKNNRILVEQGLRRIRSGRCCAGILALFAIAKRDFTRAVSTDLGFVCGPRLNAAGRLDDISIGIQCLLANTTEEATELAHTLNDLNNERKQIEVGMQEQAEQILADLTLTPPDSERQTPRIICLHHKSWHEGVIGIVAARIKQRYACPVIIFADAAKEMIKGSCRSIEGVHIRDLLDLVATQNPELLANFGGHAMAAGLTIKANDFEAFTQAIQYQVSKLKDEPFNTTPHSDGQLANTDFNLQTAEQLRTIAPWGQHFPKPVFDGEFILLSRKLLKDKHLKMELQPLNGAKIKIDAIAFNITLAEWPETNQTIAILFEYDVNSFRGNQTLQLIVNQLLS
ncbi:MAG: single-stranded-DNA-specific exonuclease RecJ [Thiotrichaceae bacterium]|nr:single-stranded-DNA-specific exonuclease RecJ [Thiotrichaceae bacterium]